jgi:hypothetical protein
LFPLAITNTQHNLNFVSLQFYRVEYYNAYIGIIAPVPSKYLNCSTVLAE